MPKKPSPDLDFNQKITWRNRNSLALLGAAQNKTGALKKGLPQGGIRPVQQCKPVARGWQIAPMTWTNNEQ